MPNPLIRQEVIPEISGAVLDSQAAGRGLQTLRALPFAFDSRFPL